jgi:CspA family cold shock protein
MGGRLAGTIKNLVDQRGFGFIKVDETGVEYFFHHSGLGKGVRFDDLRQGTRVTFAVSASPKGPRAADVELER